MAEREQRYIQDPLFWRAGAIAATIFMSMVLAALTIDTIRQITPGSPRVPAYDVINNSVAYQYDPARAEYAPKIGAEELIFGHKYSAQEAAELIGKGKLVIQSRACIDATSANAIRHSPI